MGHAQPDEWQRRISPEISPSESDAPVRDDVSRLPVEYLPVLFIEPLLIGNCYQVMRPKFEKKKS
jgi:hypothetical protein